MDMQALAIGVAFVFFVVIVPVMLGLQGPPDETPGPLYIWFRGVRRIAMVAAVIFGAWIVGVIVRFVYRVVEGAF